MRHKTDKTDTISFEMCKHVIMVSSRLMFAAQNGFILLTFFFLVDSTDDTPVEEQRRPETNVTVLNRPYVS